MSPSADFDPRAAFGRRRFLALGAGIALSGALAACGGKSGSGVLDGLDGDLQVVSRFPADALTPGTQRLALSLADKSGVLTTDGKVTLPTSLRATVSSPVTGDVLLSNLTATRHDENLAVPYWLFEFELDEAGLYLLTLDVAPEAPASFQLMDPKLVPMPTPGSPLPPFDTPTMADARGVNPICTRSEGPCPFHETTLTEALASGKRVAYLIGTPAHCTTGTCGPALEALIEVARELSDTWAFVHAEVYADKNANTIAPAVKAYKLTYEPILYLTDAEGTLVRRLDVVFDAKELRDALA